MQVNQPVVPIKKPYKLVKPEQREQIVRMRTIDKYTLNLISNLTGVNISSVKAICRIFRNEGRIQKKPKIPIQRIRKLILVYSYDEGACDFQGVIPELEPNNLVFLAKHLSSVDAKSNFIIHSFEQNIEEVEVQQEFLDKKTNVYKKVKTELEGLEHLEHFREYN